MNRFIIKANPFIFIKASDSGLNIGLEKVEGFLNKILSFVVIIELDLFNCDI